MLRRSEGIFAVCEETLSVVKKLTNPDGAVGGDANAVVAHERIGQDHDVAPANSVQGLVRG